MLVHVILAGRLGLALELGKVYVLLGRRGKNDKFRVSLDFGHRVGRLPSCARLGSFDFPLGFARGFGKNRAGSGGGRPYAFSGFHLSTGLRAAAVSSRREMRALCGASRTNCGSSSASSAIDFMASMKRSSSSFGSLSVGSIISAP